MINDWQLLSSSPLCESPYIKVAKEIVATPSRPQGVPWFVAYRPEAAVIAPKLPNGYFVMIRQERIAVRHTLWEFPAGQLDHSDLETTALRELAEETGLTSTHLIPLGFYFTSPGFTTECCHLFLAENCTPAPAGHSPDPGEAILETRPFSPNQIQEMIASGTIQDANSLALFARLVATGHLA